MYLYVYVHGNLCEYVHVRSCIVVLYVWDTFPPAFNITTKDILANKRCFVRSG